MDSNFFDDMGDTVIQPQPVNGGDYQFSSDQHEDGFDFSATENNAQPVTVSTHNVYDADNETISKIREEEEKVQERLREKSNKEYEEKQKRKEEGRKQYEEFLAQKQAETNERRETNKQKTLNSLNNNTNVPQETSWKKVASNVPLKQGEHKGSKDITRMRESIINKRDDESRNK